MIFSACILQNPQANSNTHKCSRQLLGTWIAALSLPGVALRPTTRNLHLSDAILRMASTISALPVARWHSSTTRHVTCSDRQMPACQPPRSFSGNYNRSPKDMSLPRKSVRA